MLRELPRAQGCALVFPTSKGKPNYFMLRHLQADS
jgi:hypothetical protein